MKFKTAMDVRVGLPNEHLSGVGKNEINQPMYATSVGLIMKGFDYLETYHKGFNAGPQEVFVKPQKTVAPVMDEEPEEIEDEVMEEQTQEEKISLTDKIKTILTKMFEIEDQKIS
jgi:cell division protein FtsA